MAADPAPLMRRDAPRPRRGPVAPGDLDLLDEAAIADALRTDPSCVACHADIDPIVSYFCCFYLNFNFSPSHENTHRPLCHSFVVRNGCGTSPLQEPPMSDSGRARQLLEELAEERRKGTKLRRIITYVVLAMFALSVGTEIGRAHV